MNKTIEEISVHAQAIIDATVEFPEQYAQKIEELVASIVTVAAMAEGVEITQTINSSDLVEGRNDMGNGIIAYREGDMIRLARE